MANSLLISETPHQVLPTLAKKIGINEALFLQQLHWLLINNDCYAYEEKIWWKHSNEQWLARFPYFSESTLKRTVTSLKKQKFLLVENLTFKIQRRSGDRTNWYSIDYEKLTVLSKEIEKLQELERLEKARANTNSAGFENTVKGQFDPLYTKASTNPASPEISESGHFDPTDEVKMTRSSDQNDLMLYKTYKKDLLSSSKPAEAVFEFDLILSFILTTLEESYDLTQIDKAFAKAKLETYHQKYGNSANKGDALSYVALAMEHRLGIERRSMKAAAARDHLNDAVVDQLGAQREVINQHTQEMKPRDRNDTSWADGLYDDLDFL